MKNYHDLWVMIREEALDPKATKKAIQTTFGQREQKFSGSLQFPKDDLEQLQKTWNLYRAKEKTTRLPESVHDILDAINGFLANLDL